MLRGPIANLLLAFPSSSKLNDVADEPPEDGTPDVANGLPPGMRNPAQARNYRSLSLGKPNAMVSIRFKDKSSFTVGSKHTTKIEPNLGLFFRLLLNPTATCPIPTKVSFQFLINGLKFSLLLHV